MLILNQLCRGFFEGGRAHRVLDRADAHIATGEAVAIVGRSGSGKSTLLNLISGIDRPDSGTVEFDGRDITALGEPARTLFRRRHVGFVYQFFNLIPTLDVEENVRLALELNGVRGAEARRRSAAMLAEVGLGDRLHSAVDKLSGGEQQRVAIARALVHEPALLLADEPTGNLDEETAAQVFPVLVSLTRARGATLLIVTHDSALARSLGRVLELRDGRLKEVAVRGGEPEARGAEREAGGMEPEAHGAEPELRGAEPEAHGAEPELRGAEPEARGAEPELRGAEPEARGADVRRSRV